MSYISCIRKKIGHDRMLSVAAVVILENEKEEILLQHRADTLDYGTPGGNIELGETITEALIREVREEIGIDITNREKHLFGIYSGDKCLTIYPNKDEVEYLIIAFYIKISSNEKFIIDYNESLSVDFYSRDNLPKNIKESDKIWINKWKNKDFSVVID